MLPAETAAEIYKREAVSRLPLVRLKGRELLKVFHGDFKQLQQRNHEFQKQNCQFHQAHTLFSCGQEHCQPTSLSAACSQLNLLIFPDVPLRG
ncbi:hypothetical protein D6029_05715 [Buttiauxella izardii]|uniref:Uncharacterized protein n=1 Tax=Buttiauxella izardii TaxID=82991 RepID=A0A3A5K0W6_9ENTR|nr:hypothetical protein D6029_05715 [Buttiauxella izardii]